AAGDVVELVGDAAVEANARTGTRPLALRDLGARPGAAYAVVPPGATVTLMMTTGGRATLPSPDGAPWAYVMWQRDLEGVAGWVPARELDGEPGQDRVVQVRRAATKDVPGAAADGERIVGKEEGIVGKGEGIAGKGEGIAGKGEGIAGKGEGIAGKGE